MDTKEVGLISGAKSSDRKLLVKRLDQAMADKGLTAAQLADKLGVTRSSISYFRSGKRQPGRAMLGRMADALSVTVDYLLGESDQPEISELLKNRLIMQLVGYFQDLSAEDQQRVLEMVKLMWQTSNRRSGKVE